MTDYVYMIMEPQFEREQHPEGDFLMEYVGVVDEGEALSEMGKWKDVHDAYLVRWEFPLESDGPFHSPIVIDNNTREEHGN